MTDLLNQFDLYDDLDDLDQLVQEQPCIGCGGAVDREVLGPDGRVRVPRTVEAPYRYICNIEYRFPQGTRAMCSGTLIGPRSMLTAGHCVVGRSKTGFTVTPGRDLKNRPFSAARSVDFKVFPGFQEATRTDLAVITLDRAIGGRAGWWSTAYRRTKDDPIGTSFLQGGLPIPVGGGRVNVSGYPADKPNGAGCVSKTGSPRRCRISSLFDKGRSVACGTEPWRSYDRLVARRAGLLEYISDTCPGHSGSPVWIRRHPSKGGRVLVAVHVAGDDSLPGTAVANRGVELTAEVRRWIASCVR